MTKAGLLGLICGERVHRCKSGAALVKRAIELDAEGFPLPDVPPTGRIPLRVTKPRGDSNYMGVMGAKNRPALPLGNSKAVSKLAPDTLRRVQRYRSDPMPAAARHVYRSMDGKKTPFMDPRLRKAGPLAATLASLKSIGGLPAAAVLTGKAGLGAAGLGLLGIGASGASGALVGHGIDRAGKYVTPGQSSLSDWWGQRIGNMITPLK